MAARKLGGGRVLGSGKNLSPAAAALPTRPTSLQSPSASSISVNSSVSTATDPQDISARISFDQNDQSNGTVAASATTALACPICNEEMVIFVTGTEPAVANKHPRSPCSNSTGRPPQYTLLSLAEIAQSSRRHPQEP